ncbi:hypothetical protein C8R43DRAFT_1102780 [Mycena crocata]|nr:hypothetical protein C8R43DRAFT_1102780 [Mycena crocata]
MASLSACERISETVALSSGPELAAKNMPSISAICLVLKDHRLEPMLYTMVSVQGLEEKRPSDVAILYVIDTKPADFFPKAVRYMYLFPIDWSFSAQPRADRWTNAELEKLLRACSGVIDLVVIGDWKTLHPMLSQMRPQRLNLCLDMHLADFLIWLLPTPISRPPSSTSALSLTGCINSHRTRRTLGLSRPSSCHRVVIMNIEDTADWVRGFAGHEDMWRVPTNSFGADVKGRWERLSAFCYYLPPAKIPPNPEPTPPAALPPPLERA